MGRPRKIRKQAVSLFPFLDILACVIGNLMLMIAAVILEQVDTQPVAEAARIDGLADAVAREEAKADAIQKQLDDLRKQSGNATDALAAVRQKIAEAKQRLHEAEARLRDAAKPVERPTDVMAKLAALDEDRKNLEAELKDLERQIAAKKRPPEQVIAILPSGQQKGPRKGVFVEATKDGLVVHDGGEPWKVPTGRIASDPKFAEILKHTKDDSDAIVTFLVRPDGIRALTVGQNAAASAGARSGRVPLPGNGTLDFSATK
jgi:cell division septum initiation protein DivIVA